MTGGIDRACPKTPAMIAQAIPEATLVVAMNSLRMGTQKEYSPCRSK